MKNRIENSLPQTVFLHNLLFLFFFFITPKIYLLNDLGMRGEDLLFPLTLLLFAAALPELGKPTRGRVNKAVIMYFGYVLLQGVVFSFYNRTFVYFAAVAGKQLQFFIFFYLLMYSFRFPKLKEVTLRFITILIGLNLAWAGYQIISGRQAEYMRSYHQVLPAYAIGSVPEAQPHQAAAVFLFCFLFLYLQKGIRLRKPLLALSALAVIMTMSRVTIGALFACVLYILLARHYRKAVLRPVKTAIVMTMVLLAASAVFFYDPGETGVYATLRLRFSPESVRTGVFKRIAHWEHYLRDPVYLAHFPLNAATGMGRGYVNTAMGAWRMTADSGYLRDIVEIGILGFFLHMTVFFRMGRRAGIRKYLVVLIPYLVLSATYEVFLMSKSGGAILILSAVLLEEKPGCGGENDPA